MNTTTDKIAIMQHYEDGGRVEYLTKNAWLPLNMQNPSWDWFNIQYRIAQPEPIEVWVNEDVLGRLDVHGTEVLAKTFFKGKGRCAVKLIEEIKP